MSETKQNRLLTKKIKHEMKRNYAELRLRVKGRFLKRVDEDFVRECAYLAWFELLLECNY